MEAIAFVVEVDAQRLAEMLPPVGVIMQHKPIRLCGTCYTETHCHQIKRQFKEIGGCDGCAGRRHRPHLRLLSKGPKCDARFKIPALWEYGFCQRCLMTFAEMAEYQKPFSQ